MNRPIIPDTLADALKPVSSKNKIRGLVARATVANHKFLVDGTADGIVNEEDIIDLLSDLHHACSQAGYNWDYIRITARDHYIAECEEGTATQVNNSLVREYADYVRYVPIDSLNPNEPLPYDLWLQQEHGE